jgi:hypothetical protein
MTFASLQASEAVVVVAVVSGLNGSCGGSWVSTQLNRYNYHAFPVLQW